MTKVLPRVWYCTAGAAFVLVAVAGAALSIHPLIILGVGYLSAIIAGLFLGRVALRRNPELRFSTAEKIDGHGYLHQPFDFIMTVTIVVGLSIGGMFGMRACKNSGAEQGAGDQAPAAVE